MKKVKKFISILLSALILSVPSSVSAALLPFSDVPEYEWYYKAVVSAYEANLFAGTSPTAFSPEAPMTRAMFVQVLANKTKNFDKSNYLTSGFSDIPNGVWYTSAVEWANKNDLVSGTGNGKFSPEGYITREQMATIMYKYSAMTDNICSYTPSELDGFKDIKGISPWAQDAMAWAVTNEVMAGDDHAQLNPKASAKRCEVAQVFFNAKNVLAKDILKGSGTSKPSDGITIEQAKEIALKHAGRTAAQVTFTKSKLDWENSRRVYDIEFYADRIEYDYEIDAVSGEILSFDKDDHGSSSGGTVITLDEAKDIALKHAGFTASQVTFTNSRLDRDDGRQIYEIEFYADRTEYDYEIDAVSGKILSFEKDDHGSSSGGTVITLDEAKDIALKHAGFTASQVTFTKSKLDRDDGRQVYEIEFYVGRTEYDYEIDAVSGKIIEFDIDD